MNLNLYLWNKQNVFFFFMHSWRFCEKKNTDNETWIACPYILRVLVIFVQAIKKNLLHTTNIKRQLNNASRCHNNTQNTERLVGMYRTVYTSWCRLSEFCLFFSNEKEKEIGNEIKVFQSWSDILQSKVFNCYKFTTNPVINQFLIT